MRWPNRITGANAGGPRRLPMRARWAARAAQFGRSAWKRGQALETSGIGLPFQLDVQDHSRHSCQ